MVGRNLTLEGWGQIVVGTGCENSSSSALVVVTAVIMRSCQKSRQLLTREINIRQVEENRPAVTEMTMLLIILGMMMMIARMALMLQSVHCCLSETGRVYVYMNDLCFLEC